MGKVADHPDVEMVQGNACMHLMKGDSIIFLKDIASSYAETNEEVRRCRYQYNQIYVSVWNKLLKKAFVINNNILCQEGIIWEDQLWFFNLMKFLKKAAFVFEVTYHYKVRPQSITMSTECRTIGLNWCVIYCDILNNLTSGYEQEEFDLYGKRIGNTHIKYVREVPEFETVFQLCRDKCRVYGSRALQLRLAVCSVLGTLRYGWEIWNLMSWLIHPVKKMKAKLNAAGR